MGPSTKNSGNCVNAPPAAPPRRLLDQLADRIRFKHYSMRTEQAYCVWVRRSSSHFKPTQGGCWRRLAHEDWQTWATKIEEYPGFSENNAGKQYVIVLTSNLIEVLMIFRCPAHFNRCPHPPAEPCRRLDREGSGCVPGFARRAQAEQRPAL